MLIRGHEAGDYGPEGGRVVDLAQMSQFVDQDVIDKAWWELQGGPVDVDALWAAR